MDGYQRMVRHSPETRANIVALRASGKSVREIAADLGIGKSTVNTILRSAPDYVPLPRRVKKEKTPEAPEADTGVDHDEEIPVTHPEMHISETETYLKAIEPQAPLPSVNEKAFLADLTRKMKSRREKEEDEEEAAPKAKEVAAPPPRMQPQPPLDKGALIAKITSLVQTFSPILSAHVKDPITFIGALPGKSISDLKTTLEMLETTKTIHNGANGMRHLFTVVAGGIEHLGLWLKLRTEGYQQAILSREEELRMLFAEIAYENIESIRKVQSPTARLALLMTTTMLAVDSRNRNTASDAPSESVGAKYSDL